MADWSLNYADMETLRPNLMPRIRQAIIKFLLYTIGGGGSPSSERLQWAKDSLPNVGDLAEKISIYCMSETTFIAGGTSITDAAIQSRTEFVLTTYMMPA